MSMSKYIKGIADSKKVELAKQIKENCESLGAVVPSEIYELLEDGIEIPQKEFTTDYEEIIEIDVKDIPKEVEKIQFIISY